MNMGSRLVNRH